MLKKLASILLALALVVSVSGRAIAREEQALSGEKEVTCKKPETTWQRVKRKTSEIKQLILENKWKCIIAIVCVGGIYAIMEKKYKTGIVVHIREVVPHEAQGQVDWRKRITDQYSMAICNFRQSYRPAQKGLTGVMRSAGEAERILNFHIANLSREKQQHNEASQEYTNATQQLEAINQMKSRLTDFTMSYAHGDNMALAQKIDQNGIDLQIRNIILA
ncbi:MAG: hypothetical protein LBT58_02195 [Endomicrobium sp.]|jgi:hypothetical protein|nr:hypothetical protein [Endomicrobium sp.]